MGHKERIKSCTDASDKPGCRSKARKEKELGCQCAQAFHSFPYKDLPPPAPPDGRTDLWELQFCRWWGWNWVRKRDSHIRSCSKVEEPKKTCLISKCCEPKERRCRSKEKSSNDKSKKASFSAESPEVAPCVQQPMSTKEQFKAMCKCLLGKKKTPSGMAKLYNTPSASMCGFTQQERIGYRMGETLQVKDCLDQRCSKSKERRPKMIGRSASPRESTTCLSTQSGSENVESLYTNQPPESSTEESSEYLTVKLKHVTSNYVCPCQQQQQQEKSELETAEVGQCPEVCEQSEAFTVTIPRETKETQTCGVQEHSRSCGPGNNNRDTSYCAEKLVKMKGKKQKTICIMVCCCGTCKQCLKRSEEHTEPDKNCKCANCKNESCLKDIKIEEEPQRGCSNLAKLQKEQEITAFPVMEVSPLSTKQLSKFGTPSKNYPWVYNTASVGTTTSLGGISRANNTFSDLLNNNDNVRSLDNDLSLLKCLDSSNKSSLEDRIILDAVCDAILQEHDNKYSLSLDEMLDANNRQSLKNVKEFGLLCNLIEEKNKTDTEDVAVQLSEMFNMNCGLDQDIDRIDQVMDLMDDMFSSSRDNVINKSIEHTPRNMAVTRTGLLPCDTYNTFRSRGKCGQKPEDCKTKKKGSANTNIFAKIDDILYKSKEKAEEIRKTMTGPNSATIDGILKRNYPMSSDTFANIESMTGQFDYSRDDLTVIMEDNKSNETSVKGDEDTAKNAKLAKLSVHSFLVVDEKPSVEASQLATNKVTKKISKKVSSKGSFIPIRKRGY